MIQHIESKDFENFKSKWITLKEKLNEKEKQEILVEILIYHYEDREFSFFKKVFDLLLTSKINLNFSIEHWAPTILSQAIDKASTQLFEYFLKKGATLNYVSDTYLFETIETIKTETEEFGFQRYMTCLDFAERKFAEMISIDYHYAVPKPKDKIENIDNIQEDEFLTVRKKEYYYLIEQSQYLHDLVHTDRLITTIKNQGGKLYSEINI